jgi:DNA adenine methylase
MVNSPLRYPGGKSRAASLISSLITNYNEFREPFVGGGSVYIYQKQINPNKTFWINDLYKPVYNFWNQAKLNIDLLIETIRDYKTRYDNGKQLYIYLKENFDNFSELEKAAAFFIFNRITFSGTSDSGGFSQSAYEGRFTESSIDRIKPLELILHKTNITNLDYQEVVEYEGDNVFIFLDPPYYSATKSALYGKNGNLHKGFDHIRFANVMKACKHDWLVTYDDSEYIRELFSFANIFSWDLKYGMRNVSNGSNQNGKELFISNYLTELPKRSKQSTKEKSIIQSLF